MRGKGTQVTGTGLVLKAWVIRTLSLRIPSHSLTLMLAGNDSGAYLVRYVLVNPFRLLVTVTAPSLVMDSAMS